MIMDRCVLHGFNLDSFSITVQLSKVVTFQYVQSVSSRTCASCLGASVLLKVVVVEVMHTHMMPSIRVVYSKQIVR